MYLTKFDTYPAAFDTQPGGAGIPVNCVAIFNKSCSISGIDCFPDILK